MTTSYELNDYSASTSEELATLVCKNETLDRVLALHPKLSIATIERLSFSDDDETKLNLLFNPNLTADSLVEIVSSLSADSLGKAHLLKIFEAGPSLMSFVNRDALKNVNCPEMILSWVAEHGEDFSKKMAAVLNRGLSDLAREHLNLDSLQLSSLGIIEKSLADSIEEESDRTFIEKFIKISAPFCVPMFGEIEAKDIEHRKTDMIGGYPFTNKFHPWPKCENGNYKQPIAQINLTNAGRLLNLQIGTGLLQVWANVIDGGWDRSGGWPFNEDSGNFEIRVIPEAALLDGPNDFFPGEEPWNTPEDEADEDEHPCLILHSASSIKSPLIKWVPFGSMFLSKFSHEYAGKISDDFHLRFLEEFPEQAIPNPEAEFYPRGIYLGGFGGGRGGQSQPFPLKFDDEKEGTLLLNLVGGMESNDTVFLSIYCSPNGAETPFGVTYYRYS